MTSVKKVHFWLSQYIAVLFWGIPMDFQKPFKIIILIFLAYLSAIFIKNTQIKGYKVLLTLIGIGLLILSFLHAGFQSSIINIILSYFAILIIPVISKGFSLEEKRKARKIAFFLILLMCVQLCIYRSHDGRPNLGYELNNSASFLFIFFVYSKYIRFKYGVYFVFCASLLLLSRLLLVSLLLYYIIHYIKKYFKTLIISLNWTFVQISTYILFIIFNFVFLLNVDRGEAYDTSINRVTSFNDGSNFLRFNENVNIVSGLFYDKDKNLKYGYGNIVSTNSSYYDRYFIMPHNEFLDSIAEFGYIFSIYSLFFSGLFYRKVFSYDNCEIIIAILVYTLILWTRFLIVPSIEMFYLLLLLYSINYEKYNIVHCK